MARIDPDGELVLAKAMLSEASRDAKFLAAARSGWQRNTISVRTLQSNRSTRVEDLHLAPKPPTRSPNSATADDHLAKVNLVQVYSNNFCFGPTRFRVAQ